MFADYRPLAGQYDEMFDAQGKVRPESRDFVEHLESLGAADIRRRWEQAQRLIHENGVTYNVLGDQQAARPWHLDAVPLLIPEAKWKGVSEALEQRARLLNEIVADLLGPQKLLRAQVLPAELLYLQPHYYRAYNDLPAAGGRHLHFYAADLARSPDGQWWIVGDHSRAPSGIGYALENRIATYRMLTGIFRHCRVQRLAPFFITLQETLKRLAPRFRDNPRIALYSQGPTSPHYFEDAYLARYLGYTLAQGGDLAVRNNQVMLKTLGGLLPVEVVFRRLDDEDCDPVELRPDSTLGTAGFVEAVRDGHVSVVNALGSRLVEAPALMAFLPSVAKYLWGETLKMPSVATWWCGDTYALKYVLEHLDQLAIRPAFSVNNAAPVYPVHMGTSAKEELISRLKTHGAHYVAQEQVIRSTAPVMNEGGMQPWQVALRTYLVASAEKYETMPGGLVRVSQRPGALEWSMTAGQRSQDLWILAKGPIEDISLLEPAGQPVSLRRSGAELPSRVADNLFWLGRNIERAEGSARLLRALFLRLTSESEGTSPPGLPPLLRALAEQGHIEPGFVLEDLRGPLPQLEQVLPESVFNEQEPRSLRASVNEILRLASIVRDRISIDAWRIVNQVDQRARRPRRRFGVLEASDVLAVLNHVILDLSAFSGLSTESMTRTQGWRFLELGRRLERAIFLVTLIQATMLKRTSMEAPVLDAVLEVADSQMTYRSRYLASLQPAPVLDLLITDETNPRSIAYQLAKLVAHVDALPRDSSQPVRRPDERIALSMLNSVRLAEVAELCVTSVDGQRKQLERLLQRFAEQLPRLSDAIANQYLIHSGIARQFSLFRPEEQR